MTPAREFTAKQITQIINSLPPGIPEARAELLPRILKDWSKVDLPNYFSIDTGERVDLIKRLNTVSSAASKLSKALDAINRHDDSFWIIREAIKADGKRLTQKETKSRRRQFEYVCDFLIMLSSASDAAADACQIGRGKPRNNAASLVLMDVAAIYEWATKKKATRQDEDGPFWIFAASIWPPVFEKGDVGLSSTLKNWAAAKKRKAKGTYSPLLSNIAMRHPEWGIFGLK
jgi:hypothetical protein